jgi:Tol biopolymer transport system component
LFYNRNFNRRLISPAKAQSRKDLSKTIREIRVSPRLNFGFPGQMKKLIFIFTITLSGVLTGFAQSDKAYFYQSLAWSPDGKNLSVTAMSDYDEKTDAYRTEIFVLGADGSSRQKISGAAKHAFSAVWSPDGRRIFFSADTEDGAGSNIFSVSKDGSGLIQLTKTVGHNTAPSVSPDGQKIAFMSTRDGEKYQLYVMNADGSNVKKLTTEPSVSFCNPVWSKDGRRIVYYSDKGDRKDQLWLMKADGTGQTRLTDGGGHNIFPSFSPDGKRIIFSRRADRDADRSYVDASYLFTINADGSKLTPLAEINSFFARFSPDGRKLAFVAGKFPANAIFIARADGSKITKLSK